MNRKARRAQAARERRGEGGEGGGHYGILFGGRTLVLHVFVNTSEEVEEVCPRLQEAARGAEKRMVLIAGRPPYAPEAGASIWESQQIPTFFEGRTLFFDVYVNTDERIEDVSHRIMLGVRIPERQDVLQECGGNLAVVVAGGEAPSPQDAAAMWKTVVERARRQTAGGPN